MFIFSALPEICVQEARDMGIDCLCYYDQIWEVNILNCTASVTGIISVEIIQIPDDTDWFVLQNTNLEYFCLNDTKDVSVIKIPKKSYTLYLCRLLGCITGQQKHITRPITKQFGETPRRKFRI